MTTYTLYKDALKHSRFAPIIILLVFTFISTTIYAKDKIELDTTFIKGNTELPKILYVVPWQDKLESKVGKQKLVLHSLFGDIFEPVAPAAPTHQSSK